MDEQTRQQFARRAAPYGLDVVPETTVDERTERAVQQRWQRLCEQHGAAILGIRDVPTAPVLAQLEGVRWELGPLGTAERWVPAEVFHRVRALEVAGVPFHYWLWGDEQPERPNLQPLPERSPAYAVSGGAWPTRPRDPLLIGVIPTAPSRGLWVLLGRWFH